MMYRVTPMKIGFVSLGCPKNLVDSEVMMGLSQEGGHTLTPNPADADVLVVNTCAFIDSAKEESVNTILELAEFKKNGNCKRLVVTGCLGERYRDELKAQIPEIDAVLGTGDVPEIVGAIEGAQRESNDSADARSGPNPESRVPNPGSANVPVRRRVTSRLHDAAALRVHQGRRGLRLQVLVLHHPDAARPLPQPAGRGDRPRGAVARRARRARADPDLAGHHVLRHAIWAKARRFRRCCASSTRSTASTGSGCSTCIRRRSPTTSSTRWPSATRSCKYIDLPLQHAADDVLRRMKRPGTGTGLREAARPDPRARSRRLTENNVHRGIPGRDRRRVRASCARSSGTSGSTTSASSPTRTRKARRRTICRTTCLPPSRQKRRNSADGRAEAHRRAGAEDAGRHAGAGDGGRPLARARARLAGPAGRSGARYRPGGVFHRRGPRLAAAGSRFSRPKSWAPASTIWSPAFAARALRRRPGRL